MIAYQVQCRHCAQAQRQNFTLKTASETGLLIAAARRDRMQSCAASLQPSPVLLYVFFALGGGKWLMYLRLPQTHRTVPVLLGALTLAGVLALLVRDAIPRFFPAQSHDFLAAFSLAVIAIAYLIYQAAHRPRPWEIAKAVLLAAAFLFWAANQLWPALPQATLFNDIAIALFVLDVFLVIVGWPSTSPDESFAETYGESAGRGPL